MRCFLGRSNGNRDLRRGFNKAVLMMKWVHKEEEKEMEKSWCAAERRGRNAESEEKYSQLGLMQ